jgi:hypothetical protein
MRTTTLLRHLFGVAASLSLAACGGSLATIGGTVNGLDAGASVVLQNNDTDNLTVTTNGPFSFTTTVAGDGAFDVTVLTQPAGQTCSVADGIGLVDTESDPVSNVAVTCATSASVGGTVSGLNAGTSVTLSNAGVALPIAVNGAFAFPGVLAAGTSYDVTVTTQPAGQVCSVLNPSGVVVADVVASVSVTCN